METFIFDLCNYHFSNEIKVKKSDIINWVACYHAIFQESEIKLSDSMFDSRIDEYKNICKGKYIDRPILQKANFINELIKPTLGHVIFLHQAYIIYTTIFELDTKISHKSFIDYHFNRELYQVKLDYISILVNDFNFEFNEAKDLISHLILCPIRKLASYNDCIKEAETIISNNLDFRPFSS